MTNINIPCVAFGVKPQRLTEKGACFVEAYVDNSCKNLAFNQVLNFFLANSMLYPWLVFLSLLSGLLKMKTRYTNLTGNITA